MADDLAEPEPAQTLAFTVAIGNMQEHVGAVLAAAMGGYRAQLVDAGFTEGAAELMAIDYHRRIVDTVIVSPNVDSP